MRGITLYILIICCFFSCRDRNAENPTTSYSEKEIQEASSKANTLFNDLFEKEIMSSPEWMAYLGRKERADEWDQMTEEKAEADLAFNKSALEKIKAEIEPNQLDAMTQVSYKLAIERYEDAIKNHEFRHNDYPVNQMFGPQSGIPSFLINVHGISEKEDATNYLKRLEGVNPLFDQLIEQLKKRQSKNVIPPKFVFPHVIGDCTNILKGFPLSNDKEPHVILKDFKNKVEKLEIPKEEKSQLIARCEKILKTSFKEAYVKLKSYLSELEKKATTEDGVWKFDNGSAYYKSQLANHTSTNLTAEEIHQIGLDEVNRIHAEMRLIMKETGFKGDLPAFFDYMKKDKKFYYPNTKEGKKAYLDKATEIIDQMKLKLDDLFITKPKAALRVKAVESFREQSAGKAFYESPAPDGSRPGTYFANTYKMEDMPTYQMEALAYHEAIPGHHMQLSIAQEMDALPEFRKHDGHTAYIEGWGLYSEYIPKELGFYEDPYSDFGRLAMELWRACRLVVDTGIHHKKWTRDEGIEYYKNNTPNPIGDAIKMVERHIVMPGQATAYKIGMIKILELREKAKKELKEKFDIRDFHEVLLTNGSVSMNILEDLISDYIASKK